MNKVKWPKNPKHGEEFAYIDTISGCHWVFFVYHEVFGIGEWRYLRTE